MRARTLFLSAGLLLLGSLGAMVPYFAAAFASPRDEQAIRGRVVGVSIGLGGVVVSIVLYFVARVLHEKARSLREDEAQFGPLSEEEKADRQRWLRRASAGHWRKLRVGTAWIGGPLAVMAVLVGTTTVQPGLARGLMGGLALGGYVLFLRWLEQWRFVFRNEKIVHQTQDLYYLQRNWEPQRLRHDPRAQTELPPEPGSRPAGIRAARPPRPPGKDGGQGRS